jgi:hypothetical protein
VKMFFLPFLAVVLSANCGVAADADRALRMSRIDVENEVRAVVFADLVKTAQKVVGQKATFVLVARVIDMDYIASNLSKLKPMVLCAVKVTINSEAIASAEASFEYAELGGEMFQYELSKHKDGWSIVAKKRTGGI